MYTIRGFFKKYFTIQLSIFEVTLERQHNLKKKQKCYFNFNTHFASGHIHAN